MSKRVILVHGYGGYPDEGWRPWLIRELEKRGYEVRNPAMPDTEHPKLNAWREHLSKEVGEPDEDCILIGHSLGTIAILRYLESLKPGQKVGKVILVGSFSQHLDERFVAIREFTEEPVDWDAVRSHCAVFHVIHSDSDTAVPLRFAEHVAEHLGVSLELHPGYHHFSGDDGITEVPMVLEDVLS